MGSSESKFPDVLPFLMLKYSWVLTLSAKQTGCYEVAYKHFIHWGEGNTNALSPSLEEPNIKLDIQM